MKLRITVHGVAYEVDVEILDVGEGFAMSALPPAPRQQGGAPVGPGGSGPSAGTGVGGRSGAGFPPPGPAVASGSRTGAPQGTVTSPIAGTVIEVRCAAGDIVKEKDVLMVFEAMKMNTSIAAPGAGTVTAVHVSVGDAVREGQILVEFQ
jgi:biotin carboxyl carrier protein